MTQISVDITGRFGAAFGSSVATFAARNVLGRVNYNPYQFESFEDTLEGFEDTTFKFEDQELNFEAMPFKAKNKRPFHVPLSGNDQADLGNIVAPPPLLKFSRGKKHIETDLNEDGTTVVERWKTSPYTIQVRGILVDMDNHQYPTEKVNLVHKLFNHNNIVEVIGRQWLEKEIYYLYFRNAAIEGVQGFKDTVKYSFEARQAKEANFTLLKPN